MNNGARFKPETQNPKPQNPFSQAPWCSVSKKSNICNFGGNYYVQELWVKQTHTHILTCSFFSTHTHSLTLHNSFELTRKHPSIPPHSKTYSVSVESHHIHRFYFSFQELNRTLTFSNSKSSYPRKHTCLENPRHYSSGQSTHQRENLLTTRTLARKKTMITLFQLNQYQI